MKSLKTVTVIIIIVASYVAFLSTGFSSSFIQVKSYDLFSIHSREYPSQLWMNLDATITEVRRGDRYSLYSISEREGTQGAGAIGRFFFCSTIYASKQRGFRYFVNSEPVDDHIMVVYLKNEDEDISDLHETIGEEYLFHEQAVQVETGVLNNLCGIFLGDVYLRKKEYVEAVANYSNAIDLDHKNARAYAQRGLAYLDSGQYESGYYAW